MGLNMTKLKEVQEDLNEKASGGGDKLFFHSNKIGKETFVRGLPPLPKMNGIYYVEQEGYWLQGKFYQVNSTFKGGVDVFKEEIDAAKKTKDADLIALIDAKKEKKPVLKRELRYMMPILLLDVKFDKNDEIEEILVVDDEAKIFVVKPTLITEINKIVTHRNYQNGTEDGIFDREKGYNIILSKTGADLNTKYGAMGDKEPIEMPEEYYAEDKIPDVMEIVDKARLDDDYLRKIIRNYLYGEPMPDEKAKATPVPAADAGGKKIIVKKNVSDAKGETADAPATTAATKKAAVKKPVVGKGGAAARNVLDDAEKNNGEDEQFKGLDD